MGSELGLDRLPENFWDTPETPETPESDYGLSRLPEGWDTEQPQEPAVNALDTLAQEVQPTQEPESYNRAELGRFIEPIRKYNFIMRGAHSQDWTDEEQIEKYTNQMRWFDSGNGYTTVQEVGRLVSLDKEQLNTVGEGYAIWKNMEGLFSEDNTWGETGSGLWDYTKAVVMDPANLIGFGLGKLVTTSGAKAGGKAAQFAAMQAFRESIKEGSTHAIAKEAADVIWSSTMKATAEAAGMAITEATATTQATKFLGKMATKDLLKEVGVAVTVDAAVAVGIETAYQSGLILTGAQEEVEYGHLALAALGTMALGGISFGSAAMKGVSGFTPHASLPKLEKAPKEMLDSIMVAIENTVARDDSWKSKVARGFEIKDLDHSFWHNLLMDPENGVLVSMEKAGYIWYRSGPDDRVSNFVADALKSADPVDASKFMDDFVEKTGLKMPEMEGVPLGVFADNFALKMNQAAVIMNDVSQLARKLGKEVKDVTLNDVAGEVLDPTDLPTSSWIRKAESGLHKVLGRGPAAVSKAQSNLLRLIVSNISTTRLNVVGAAASSAMNSATDVSMAALYGVKATFHLLTSDVKNTKEAGRMAKVLFQMQLQKASNLLDPNTVMDQFVGMSLNRPGAMGKLTHTSFGGVESSHDLLSRQGFDPDLTNVGRHIDNFVDGVSYINFVKGQDILTKSQEFIYQIDKNLRISTGRSLKDVWADPNVRTIMSSDEYLKAEAKAIFETESAIYSVSYKGRNFVGEAAGFIEDFRKIPVVGVLIPFGRFFNNVLATTMTNSGGMLVAKALGNQTERGYVELGTRAALAWGMVGAMVPDQIEGIKNGLDMFDVQDKDTGVITDIRYTFPFSLFYGAARIIAYKREDKEPPQSELEAFTDSINVFKNVYDFVNGKGEIPPDTAAKLGTYAVGQLTRQLGEAGQGVASVMEAFIQGNPEEKSMMAELFGGIGTQIVSGATRPFEPINVMLKLVEGTDMVVMDKRQGNTMVNQAFRYMDSVVDLDPKQRYTAAGGKEGIQPEKFLGERTRELSDTERAMNLVGDVDWKASSFTQSPAADNRFNQLFHSTLEVEASKLMKNPKFRGGDLKTKTRMWNVAKGRAKKLVMGLMAIKINKEGVDPLLKLSLDISSSNSRAKISQALVTIASGREIEELSYNELVLLEAYLKNQDTLLDIQANQ